jgi:hypothetical protein
MGGTELPLVLRISRLVELAVIAFFALCAYALADDGLSDWQHWVAFGICVFFVLIGVASLAAGPRLEITETAITDVGLFSRKTYELRKCGRFQAYQYHLRGAGWVVRFDYEPDHGNAPRQAPNSSIPTHARDANELAALLNRARDHARRT